MFAEAAFAALLLATQSIVIPLGHPRVNEAPKAPIEIAGPLWASACEGSGDPNKAAPPVRLHGNSYLVGTCGRPSILIVGEEGDILIDGGETDDEGLIADNIRSLGYSPADIKYILHSDAGPGQLGGIPGLQRMSGATVAASAAAASLLRSGAKVEPQPVAVGRIVGEGSEIRLGDLLLTAIAASNGGLSWRWESCDGGVCRTIVYAASLAPGDSAAAARIAASPCEILVSSVPAASGLAKRLVLGEPLFDANACKVYAAASSAK